MRETVLSILQEIRPEIDFETETGLVTDGVLESFDLLAIIAYIQDETGIEITNDHISVENFNSLDDIVRMVEELKK